MREGLTEIDTLIKSFGFEADREDIQERDNGRKKRGAMGVVRGSGSICMCYE